MPSLMISPSRRMTLTTMRPSMTMLSPGLRERMSIKVCGLDSGHRQRMAQRVLRGVVWDDLLANASMTVDDDGSLQVDGGLSVLAQDANVQDLGVGWFGQAKEFNIISGNVRFVRRQHQERGNNQESLLRAVHHLQPLK